MYEMLQSPIPMKTRDVVANEPERASDNVSRLFTALRRGAWLFAAFVVGGLAIGIVYVMTATPLYTAAATVMIDDRQLRAVRDVAMHSDAPVLDIPAVVESQVEVLRSEKIGLGVIEVLHLASDDPAFLKPGWTDRLRDWFAARLQAVFSFGRKPPDINSDLTQQLKVLNKLNRNLRVNRVGHSFVLEVSYTAPVASRAAEIANAYTKSFLLEQMNSNIEGARRARQWLQQRADELRQMSINADLAAQKYRAEHNLLTTKGMLVSEQQLSEMTTQLITAQAATSQARARYLRIKEVLESHQTDSAVTESVANPVISTLRTKYLEAAKRKAELERKLGADHITVVNLKNAMDQFKTLLFQELGQIAETYRNDHEVAEAREKTLSSTIAAMQKVAIAANEDQVQLTHLEQQAQSYKTLYQTFLQRYQETEQQENFPLTDAHVVSAAIPSLVPSQPRSTLVLALSLGLGIIAGASAAMLRELTDHGFRTADQVRDELGLDVLGLLPIVTGAATGRKGSAQTHPLMRHAVDHPFSAFAECLRSVKVAADLRLKHRHPKVLGIVSLLPGEGKSTVARNFACLLASQRATTTLLIDGDTRNPTLTRAIDSEGAQASPGDNSSKLAPLGEHSRYEPESNLYILPCRGNTGAVEGLSPDVLHDLVQGCNGSFEYIVIDLPPIGPVVNARGIAPAIDAFVLVVEWGTTARAAVRATLANERLINEKILGVILNKVDMKKLKSYESPGSGSYYHSEYSKYYSTSESRSIEESCRSPAHGRPRRDPDRAD
jgi:succinoglycan biosynthesis transport protein ExoP